MKNKSNKVLVSFRFDSDTLAALDYLASVYTHGNKTVFLERVVRRYWWLEPLALFGKYRTPGFGISLSDRVRFKSAWDIFTSQVFDNHN